MDRVRSECLSIWGECVYVCVCGDEEEETGELGCGGSIEHRAIERGWHIHTVTQYSTRHTRIAHISFVSSLAVLVRVCETDQTALPPRRLSRWLRGTRGRERDWHQGVC